MVSFIIALHIDSEDRLNNLRISTGNIKQNFPNAEIIIVELDTESKIKEKGISVSSHLFVEYSDFFSKTMAFNIGAQYAKNEVICLYDCDVVLDSSTINNCVKHISNKTVEIMYPYNGYFLDVPKKYHKTIESELNLSCVDLNECRVLSDRSVGGAVFFDRKTFLEGGGANENIKIGYEDNEIFERFRILGYKIGRINKPILHLEHERKETSFDYNPYKEIFEREFIRITRMNKPQLLEEIKKWKK